MNKNTEAKKTTNSRKAYKPFWFPWAAEACEAQHKMHWMPYEIDLNSDLKEFNHKLTDDERKVLLFILRFFTQADVEVGRCYLDYYIPIFKCPEIRMMLTTFASMEVIHVISYSYLITALQLPDSEYEEFLNYQEMVDKYDYMQSFSTEDPEGIAATLAIVSGFIEGFVLFASFTILLSFSMNREDSCLHGIGQIITFSIRDETLHSLSVIKLFHEYCKENEDKIDKNRLKEKILEGCKTLIHHELAFLDLIFKDHKIGHVSKEDLQQFIYFLADLRLGQLGMEPLYGVSKNPLEWTKGFLYFKEIANFFETTPTAYTKADLIQDSEGASEDIWSKYVG